jgi:hypothetical protein
VFCVCRARWRGENRTIFNTPNPRLMNVSLLDSKLLHGGNLERRASRGSVRGAPSRHASMTSLRPANSPTGNSIVMTSSASARVHASGNAANHPPNTTTTTTVTSTQWPPKLRGDPLAGEDHNARLYTFSISLFAKKIYIFLSQQSATNSGTQQFKWKSSIFLMNFAKNLNFRPGAVFLLLHNKRKQIPVEKHLSETLFYKP